MKTTLALLASPFLALTLFTADARRPNIVFIFSDDHAYQAISAYADPRKLNETLNLDRMDVKVDRFGDAGTRLAGI